MLIEIQLQVITLRNLPSSAFKEELMLKQNIF